MRKIAANYIFPVTSPPIKYGILYLDENNTVVKIKDNNGKMVEEQGCEYYSGVIIPGLVNMHTHLELSYLKGYVKERCGMEVFIDAMIKRPQDNIDAIRAAADMYDKLMYNQGIVAVGDISNTIFTLETKANSMIHYHTFVELLGLTPSTADEFYHNGVEVCNMFKNRGLVATITPHAPYSVSKRLLHMIANTPDNQIFSIHTLENSIEQEQLSSSNDSFKRLFQTFGITGIEDQNDHPFEFILRAINNKSLIAVHNTHTTTNDWKVAQTIANENNIRLFAVTCPRSNVYINNIMPDYSQWTGTIDTCIGTDSLASNTDLSVFNEIQFLLDKTDIPFSRLLTWATLNGAKAISIDNRYGSFDEGKTPGVNLITHFDYNTMSPTRNATIKRLA